MKTLNIIILTLTLLSFLCSSFYFLSKAAFENERLKEKVETKGETLFQKSEKTSIEKESSEKEVPPEAGESDGFFPIFCILFLVCFFNALYAFEKSSFFFRKRK